MVTGYHDDSNNPRNNLVVHRAAANAERGIPAVGKLVYRTDTSALEVCSDTSPNPTLNGGGTWGGIGFGQWLSWAPTSILTAVTTNPTNNGSSSTYATSGTACAMLIQISFNAGFTAGSGEYRINTPVKIDTNGAIPIGTGWAYDVSADTWYPLIVRNVSVGSTTCRMLVAATGGGASFVTHAYPFTWATGDLIYVNLLFEIQP
jgi:hypothetical protein